MSRKKYFKRAQNPLELFNDTVQMYRNKYFNLYRAQFKWNGINYRQEDFIMRKFWGQGTVAAFKIANIDELGFAPWAMQSWDMYDLPETVLLINEHASPLIPKKVMTVDKDVCLGYIQRNKKPMFAMVDWYIQRIAQVEMVINTNLNLQKMPFLIPVDENADKVTDVVDRILNNEIVVTVEGVDPNEINAVLTQAPYLVDKLVNYKVSLENELKSFLGINNQGVEKIEQLQLSEVNANNDEIMDSENNFLDCLQEWCKNIKETLGIDISVESTNEPVEVEGQVHDGDKPGPKEDEEDDN